MLGSFLSTTFIPTPESQAMMAVYIDTNKTDDNRRTTSQRMEEIMKGKSSKANVQWGIGETKYHLL